MQNPVLIGFLQATGIASYIILVASFIRNLENWASSVNEFLAPIMFLTLFSVSVLVCGLLALGYPVRLFWIEKKPKMAINIVAFTTLFLLVFLCIVIYLITSGSRLPLATY